MLNQNTRPIRLQDFIVPLSPTSQLKQASYSSQGTYQSQTTMRIDTLSVNIQEQPTAYNLKQGKKKLSARRQNKESTTAHQTKTAQREPIVQKGQPKNTQDLQVKEEVKQRQLLDRGDKEYQNLHQQQFKMFINSSPTNVPSQMQQDSVPLAFQKGLEPSNKINAPQIFQFNKQVQIKIGNSTSQVQPKTRRAAEEDYQKLQVVDRITPQNNDEMQREGYQLFGGFNSHQTHGSSHQFSQQSPTFTPFHQFTFNKITSSPSTVKSLQSSQHASTPQNNDTYFPPSDKQVQSPQLLPINHQFPNNPDSQKQLHLQSLPPLNPRGMANSNYQSLEKCLEELMPINTQSRERMQIAYKNELSPNLGESAESAERKYLVILNDQENIDSNPSYDLYNSQEQIEVEFLNDHEMFMQSFEHNTSGNEDEVNPIEGNQPQFIDSNNDSKESSILHNRISQSSKMSVEISHINDQYFSNRPLKELLAMKCTSSNNSQTSDLQSVSEIQQLESSSQVNVEAYEEKAALNSVKVYSQLRTPSKYFSNNIFETVKINDNKQWNMNEVQVDQASKNFQNIEGIETNYKIHSSLDQSQIIRLQNKLQSQRPSSDEYELKANAQSETKEQIQVRRDLDSKTTNTFPAQIKNSRQGFNYAEKLTQINDETKNAKDQKQNKSNLVKVDQVNGAKFLRGRTSQQRDSLSPRNKETLDILMSKKQFIIPATTKSNHLKQFSSPHNKPKNLFGSQISSQGSFNLVSIQKPNKQRKAQPLKGPHLLISSNQMQSRTPKSQPRQFSSKRNQLTIKSSNNSLSPQARPLQPLTVRNNPKSYLSNKERQHNSLSPSESNKDKISQSQKLTSHNYPVTSLPIDLKAYVTSLKEKEAARQQLIHAKELEGFTGRPQINKKSKSIRRRVDDLINWKEEKERKRKEESEKRQIQECNEVFDFQRKVFLSKKSQSIAANRLRGLSQEQGVRILSSRERVEERLMQDAIKRKQQRKIREQMAEGNRNERDRIKSQEELKIKECNSTNQIIQILESKGVAQIQIVQNKSNLKTKPVNKTAQDGLQIKQTAFGNNQKVEFSYHLQKDLKVNSQRAALKSPQKFLVESLQRERKKDLQSSSQEQKLPTSLSNTLDDDLVNLNFDSLHQISADNRVPYTTRNKDKAFDSTQSLSLLKKTDYLKRFIVAQNQFMNTTNTNKDDSTSSMPIVSNLLKQFNKVEDSGSEAEQLRLSDNNYQVMSQEQLYSQLGPEFRVSLFDHNNNEGMENVNHLEPHFNNSQNGMRNQNSTGNSLLNVPIVSVNSPLISQNFPNEGLILAEDKFQNYQETQVIDNSSVQEEGYFMNLYNQQSQKDLFDQESLLSPQRFLLQQNSSPQLQSLNILSPNSQNQSSQQLSAFQSKFRDHQNAIINKILDNSEMPSGSAYKLLSPSSRSIMESQILTRAQLQNYEQEQVKSVARFQLPTGNTTSIPMYSQQEHAQIQRVISEPITRAVQSPILQLKQDTGCLKSSTHSKMKQQKQSVKLKNTHSIIEQKTPLRQFGSLQLFPQTCKNSQVSSPLSKAKFLTSPKGLQKSKLKSPSARITSPKINQVKDQGSLKFIERSTKQKKRKENKRIESQQYEEQKQQQSIFKPHLFESDRKITISPSSYHHIKSKSTSNKIVQQQDNHKNNDDSNTLISKQFSLTLSPDSKATSHFQHNSNNFQGESDHQVQSIEGSWPVGNQQNQPDIYDSPLVQNQRYSPQQPLNDSQDNSVKNQTNTMTLNLSNSSIDIQKVQLQWQQNDADFSKHLLSQDEQSNRLSYFQRHFILSELDNSLNSNMKRKSGQQSDRASNQSHHQQLNTNFILSHDNSPTLKTSKAQQNLLIQNSEVDPSKLVKADLESKQVNEKMREENWMGIFRDDSNMSQADEFSILNEITNHKASIKVQEQFKRKLF